MTLRPTEPHGDANAATPGDPISRASTVIGWPDALRLRHDFEGAAPEPQQQLEAGVAQLFGRAHEVLEGVGLAVRLQVEGFSEDVSPDESSVQRPVIVCWPPGSSVAELLRLEGSAGTGPGLDAEQSLGPVDCGDLSSDGRWPAVTARALDQGVRSVLAVPVLDQPGLIGALVLYSSEIREYPALVMTAKLSAVASHIAVLVANAQATAASDRTIAQLRAAMLSRSVIEQAKGVLMVRERIDADTAWEYLVRISQRTHRKLRDIAIDIVTKASRGSF